MVETESDPRVRLRSHIRIIAKRLIKEGKLIETEPGVFRPSATYLEDLEFQRRNPDVLTREQVIELLSDKKTILVKRLTTVLDIPGVER